MAEPIKKAGAKRTRKAVLKAAVPVTVAKAKMEKRPAPSIEPVAAPVIKAVEPVFTQIEEIVEAVASPAVETDIAPEVVTPAPAPERILNMANVNTATEGFDKGQAMLGDVTARFTTAFEKSSKMSEEMVDFAKGNVEAVVASARVAAKAGESLGQEAADYSKKQFESATALFKSFASVKSPTDLFQLQSDFAKSSFDSAVAQASRVSESLMKIAGEIAQPLSSRYAVAAEKIKANAL